MRYDKRANIEKNLDHLGLHICLNTKCIDREPLLISDNTSPNQDKPSVKGSGKKT